MRRRLQAVWKSDLIRLLALLAALMVAALTGLLTWISEEIATMEFGDLATWLSGLATAGVALAAWHTSRKATTAAEKAAIAAERTAAVDEQARQDDLTAEAKRVDFYVEARLYNNDDILSEPDVLPLPYRPNTAEFEEELPQPHVYLVLRITNENPYSMLDGATLKLRDNEGMFNNRSEVPRPCTRIRPGHTRYWFQAYTPFHSLEPFRRAIPDMQLVEWLEFTDTRGCRWRRHAADGKLVPIEGQT